MSIIRPDYYSQPGRKTCWEEMEDKFGIDAVVILDCINAYKYHYRAGKKYGNAYAQDIAKRDEYMNHARSNVQRCKETKAVSVFLEAEREFV